MHSMSHHMHLYIVLTCILTCITSNHMQAGDVTLPIRVLHLPMAFNNHIHNETSVRNNVTLPVMQAGDVTLPIRVLHLPMAFNERWTHGAIQKYMRSVRSEGPYLPSNVDFVAANNGLTGQC